KDVQGNCTYYARDESGNILSTYTGNNTTIGQLEMPVYGSTRLGTTLKGATTKSDYLYELTDHLGNVRAILKDDYSGNNVLFSYANYYPGGSAKSHFYQCRPV
ncbi:MAG TPA: hypothetical protein VE870_17860, partial [Bacteroidales bacterium]|nr:hypothetical protein [Bacteroidales bacterium]